MEAITSDPGSNISNLSIINGSEEKKTYNHRLSQKTVKKIAVVKELMGMKSIDSTLGVIMDQILKANNLYR